MPTPSAELTVDLGAIAANYKILADKSSPARTAAALKADAYGLGIATIAPMLQALGCDAFFIATLDEGLALRALLTDAEIYVLNGLRPGEEKEFIAHNLIPVLNDIREIGLWANHASELGRALPACLHLDTGMNRLGIPMPDTLELAQENAALLTAFDLKLVMSHLACAALPDHLLNKTQLERFNSIRHALPKAPASLANTGGVMLGAPYHLHMTRPGIGLFGGMENAHHVATLKARILQVKEIKAGESVGYDATWTADKDGRIAIVALGYADGYLISYSNKGMAIIDGKRVPVIGRVSMDLLALDVSALESDKVRAGQNAVFLGEGITLNESAAWGDMHMYQVLTSIGRRVLKRYKSSELTAS